MKQYSFISRPEQIRRTDVRIETAVTSPAFLTLSEELKLSTENSTSFLKMKSALVPFAEPLSLLLYNRKKVAKVFAEYLPLCPSPALKCLQAFAGEIRSELVEEFVEQVLPVLIRMCENSEVLDELFKAISVCIRHMIKGIQLPEFLWNLDPLFSHKIQLVRHLTAKCMGYLVRKAPKGTATQIVQKYGANAWEIIVQALKKNKCLDILLESWGDREAARLAHLHLAAEGSFVEEVWNSLSMQNEIEIIKEWSVMSNGNKVPKQLEAKFITYLTSNIQTDITALGYFLKYHRNSIPALADLTNIELPSLLLLYRVIVGLEDSSPEKRAHQQILHKETLNHPASLNFTPITSTFYDIITQSLQDRGYGSQALELFLHTFSHHIINIQPIPALNSWINQHLFPEEAWLAFRTARITSTLIHTSLWENVDNEEIQREICTINKKLPERVYGELLWAASDIGAQVDEEIVIQYLSHPTLRIPAIQLLKQSKGFQLCYEIAKDPPSIDNEKYKITGLKKLSHFIDDNPRAYGRFLLGMFWERFTTIWPHINEVLSAISNSYPEILWHEYQSLLSNFSSPDNRSYWYRTYNTVVDSTPSETFYNCLLESISACPKMVRGCLNECCEMFCKFVNEEYSKYYFIPTLNSYPIYQTKSSHNRVLTLWLKIFNSQKSLKSINNKEYFKKLLIAFCMKKVEEIRVHAVDCLIKLKEEEAQDAAVLRLLAKDSSFKDGIGSDLIASGHAAIALAVGRVLSSKNLLMPAIHFISGMSDLDFPLELLPINILHFSKVEEQHEIHLRLLLKQIKILKLLILHSPDMLNKHSSKMFNFLITIFINYQEKEREVSSKTLATLNTLIRKKEISAKKLDKILQLFGDNLVKIKHDLKPRYIELLRVLSDKYIQSFTYPQVVDAMYGLVTNPKLKRHQIKISLNVLQKYIQNYALDDTSIPIISSILVIRHDITGLTKHQIAIYKEIPGHEALQELFEKLVVYVIKKPDIEKILGNWISFLKNPPVSDLQQYLLKKFSIVNLLIPVIPDPLKSILVGLSSKKKRGLNDEFDYNAQLDALSLALETEVNEPQILIYTASHLLINSELAIRSESTKLLQKYASRIDTVEHVELALTRIIKKVTKEEELRAIMLVWNSAECDLSSVSSPDEEKSLLLGIVNLQFSTRNNALHKLMTTDIPSRYISSIFIPTILFYLLFSDSRDRYNHNFTQNCITALGRLASKIEWSDFSNIVKVMVNKLESDEDIATKSLSTLMTHLPAQINSQFLSSKLLSKLKAHIVDMKEPWRPQVRKHVVLAVYSILKTMRKHEYNIEVHRLLLLLSHYFKHRDDKTKETVLLSLRALIKAEIEVEKIFNEFEHALEGEVYAVFLNKILPNVNRALTKGITEKAVQAMVQYEQFPGFYHLAKYIERENIELLVASTKPLQYVSQGLSENEKIEPYDCIQLALKILNRPLQAEVKNAKVSLKELTYSIQAGAPTGTRPKTEVKSNKKADASMVFGVELIKKSLKRCNNTIEQSLADQILQVCENSLDCKNDTVVSNSLQIVKMIGSTHSLEKVIKLTENSGEEVKIHAIKTLTSLLSDMKDIEQYVEKVLYQLPLILNTIRAQSSGLKLLRLLLTRKVMHPLIYDSMEIVPQLLVSNPRLKVQISTIYIDFLLKYELSDKRRMYHIDFLIKNLKHPYPDTKVALLDSLNTIVERFPREELMQHFDFMLLALVTALSNEESLEITGKILDIFKNIVSRHKNSSVLKQIPKWFNQANPAIRKAAILITGELFQLGYYTQEFIQDSIIENLTSSEVCSKEAIDFLNTFIETTGDKQLGKVLRGKLASLLEKGCYMPLSSFQNIDKCDKKLLKELLQLIEKGTILQDFLPILSKAKSDTCVKPISSLIRKLIGQQQPDGRVAELLRVLISKLDVKDKKPLFKVMIIASENATDELVKELAYTLFQEVHNSLGQTSFMQEYSEAKRLVDKRRSERKSSFKQLAVSHPERHAQIKMKKRLKQRLAKQKRFLKAAPYKKARYSN